MSWKASSSRWMLPRSQPTARQARLGALRCWCWCWRGVSCRVVECMGYVRAPSHAVRCMGARERGDQLEGVSHASAGRGTKTPVHSCRLCACSLQQERTRQGPICCGKRASWASTSSFAGIVAGGQAHTHAAHAHTLHTHTRCARTSTWSAPATHCCPHPRAARRT